MSAETMQATAWPRAKRWPFWISLALVAVVGTGASLFAAWAVRNHEEEMFWTEFEQQCRAWGEPVNSAVQESLALLAGLQDLFSASDQVDTEKFRYFVRRSLNRQKALKLVAWAAVTSAEAWPDLRQRAMRNWGVASQYELRNAQGQPYVPRSPQESLCPVTFVEPAGLADKYLGVNLASYTDWDQVVKSLGNTEAVAEWISAAPDSPETSRQNIIFAVAVKTGRMGRSPVPQNIQQGIVLVVLDAEQLVEQYLGGGVPEEVQVRLVAEGSDMPPAQNIVLYERAAGQATLAARSATCALETPDDVWLEFTPTQRYLGQWVPWRSWTTLAGGLVLLGLLEFWAVLGVRRREKIEAIIRKRTQEWEEAHRHLAEEARRRAEMAEELFRQQQLLYGIVENSPAVIYAKDSQGRYLFVNKRYCELFQVKAEEVVGRSDAEIFPPEFAARFQENDRAVLEHGRALEFEEFAPHSDGTHTYISVKFPVRDAQGRYVAVCGISTDITDRKRAELALRDSEALYHSLVECVPLCILRKDREGRFTFANQKFCQLLGRSAEEILGKTDYDFFPAALADKYRRDDQRVLSTGEVFEDIEEHQTPSGEKLFVQVLKSPVRDASGQIVEVQCMFMDVTDRKRAEEELRRAREAAEAANRAKSDFLANMSHEIRTPLNAIIGLTELLLQTPTNALQREYLQMILESGELLLALINDVLDFSKIEAGKLLLERLPFTLREQVGDTMKLLAARASQKGLELALDVAADVPEVVVGDAGRLRQVLLNLLSNAIKFTHQGEVVVEVRCSERTESECLLQFCVRDTGIGIPRDQQERIFQAFEQVDTSTARRYGGTGLGLAIASRLVALMGGKIWVESEPGRGSAFYFTARLGIGPSEKDGREEQLARLRGWRVLVVDDNATNRTVLQAMLRSWHLQPETASTAEEALRLLQDARLAGVPFHLVITDVAMPGMDGFQLVEAIRQQESSPPIIVMLASAHYVDDLERSQKLGVARYLLKPVKHSELLEAVLSVCAPETAAAKTTDQERPATSQALPQPKATRSLQILLVEDSLVNQRLMQGLLSSWGHEIIVADNGPQALEYFARRRFDLILMDIQMPGMDGYEVMRRIRAWEKQHGGHVPILAITARALPDDHQKCLEAGADGYLAKPIRAAALAREIERVLAPPSPAETGSAPQRDTSVATSAEPPSAASSSAESLVSLQAALSMTRGDPALLRQVVQAFLTEGPRLLAEAEQALTQQLPEILQRCAHTLAGNLRLFGAEKPAALAHDLQQAAQQRHWPRAMELIEQLRPLLQQVFQELGGLTASANSR
jgi:two-component system sensor histidine kinase/response regulator